jgi:outer membrane protein assembly factor BamB
MLTDVGRRTQAVHLAFGEGILVCPTNAGRIVGVEVGSHKTVWTYIYRDEPAPADPNPAKAPPLQGKAKTINLNTEWKTSAPVVHDGKVVFTPPDSPFVYCLNLRTGELAWKRARGDDLYLAGVFKDKVVLVGKSTCRALSLADGKPLWKLETGLPSGQGAASDNVYYLPLKSGAQSREPEVCAIDIDKGVIVAHTRSRRKEVPGNLIFFNGYVISQTVDRITAYPQLAAKLQEIDMEK